MIGIYKITSPSGKVYIGQSVNIKKRFQNYKSSLPKEQPRLYNSIKKYGFENHQFDVLVNCSFQDLNKLERYYQELYEVIGKNGLNCQLTCTKKLKIKVSDYTREKHKKRCGENHPSFGKKRTIEQRKRMSESQKKVKRKRMSEETKIKLSNLKKGLKGKKHTEETKKKISEKLKNRKLKEETKIKLRKPKPLHFKEFLLNNHWSAKKILDKKTGIIYKSLSHLSREFNLNASTISRKLNGKLKNNTNYVYI